MKFSFYSCIVCKVKMASTGTFLDSDAQVYDVVSEYYGKILQSTKDLKTSACETAGRPHPIVIEKLKQVPSEVKDKYYGCGNPIPLGISGLRVLDLGSGSGRDCYIASAMVGEGGYVTGIDMTDEQLAVANRHIDTYTKQLGYSKPNMCFKKGYIEFLEKAGVAPNSVDLVISNCVVNLSPNKELVLKSVYNVLDNGGEFYFSDVYVDRRLPEKVRQHELLWGECLAGALYTEDFKRICVKMGFADVRQLSVSPIEVRDADLKNILGNAKFYSITYRLFKLEKGMPCRSSCAYPKATQPHALESICEDYGQVGFYLGTIPGYPHAYALDDHHTFETNKPMLVCGNSASMISETWLFPHFKVIGDRSVHFGRAT